MTRKRNSRIRDLRPLGKSFADGENYNKKYLSHDMTKPTKWVCAQWRLRSAGHPPSLIRVFAVHMKKAGVLSYPLSAQRRLSSDWADSQADLSLHWAHSHFALGGRAGHWCWVASSAGVSCYFCIVGQGPAVLAAGAGRVSYIFFYIFLSIFHLNVLSFGRWLNMTEIL